MDIARKKIISTNITCVFKELDYASLDLDGLKNFLVTKYSEPQEEYNITEPIEYHIYSFFDKRFIITLDDNRLTVEDRSDSGPGETDLMSRFTNIFDQFFKKFELSAYGFNLMVQVEAKDTTNLSKQTSAYLSDSYVEKIKLLGTEFGLRFSFEDITYQAQITNISPSNVGITINAQYDTTALPSLDVLQKQYQHSWDAFENLVSSMK